MATDELLQKTVNLACEYTRGVRSRPVNATASAEDLRASLGGPLPEDGLEPEAVITALARNAEPGLVATSGPRFFGFVIGGSVPAALAADWLATAWDQNASLHVVSPAAAIIEEVTAPWILSLLGLPAACSVGFVTGGQMANFTCLAAARHDVLRQAGWSVEDDGLAGAPPVQVIVGAEAHATIFAALSMLGLGRNRATRVATDEQGRMRPDELVGVLQSSSGPTIVCAQAGNVNTGAFDPIREIARLTHECGGWLHVDGAFGLWARASAAIRPLVVGVEDADSWAIDAHKWLNVPYDSGIAIVGHPDAHRAAMRLSASYLKESGSSARDPDLWTPESSRRARGIAIYAALKSLGRRGAEALVDRCCGHARHMADRLGQAPCVTVLNDVVLNQVLARFDPPAGGDADRFTQAVLARVQSEGTCYPSGANWHGLEVMRISISNWSTTEEDIDASADAILKAATEEGLRWESGTGQRFVMRGNRFAPWLRAAAVFVVIGGADSVSAQAPQVSPSLIIMYADDLDRCPAQIDRAYALIESDTVNFVPHLFYRNDDDANVVSFCQRYDDHRVCAPITDSYVRAWQEGWEACFGAAVARGLDIAIVPHLDGAEASSRWRNEVGFDPSAAYPSPASRDADVSHSYREVFLEPLVAALERTVTPETHVSLALQGEMGRTVFEHPDEYLDILEALRARLGQRADAEVGISLNFNKLPGFMEIAWFEDSAEGRSRRAAVQRLVNRLDFLGLSAYRETHGAPTAFDFREAIRRFLLDWTYQDLSLPNGLPLTFSEVGIGGGRRDNDGRLPAQSALEAALHPWSGVFGVYDAATDPWRHPELRDFRRAYFTVLLDFLSNQVASSRVTKVFLWNIDSWDVLGLFPGMEPYRDEAIVDVLRTHNRR